ncbi:hypothetical protein AJ79_07423 [Helicocarpus griseus UAMH5409]|uniref:Zn(2)-C6 fungal-type domain-containing protein n=1 Tax=Helicocarpus griseus UAMH5409 TaxID=1447875 RepID=A0A2B7X3H0_9EURO|nr:hypothetical protein AJ79_07423 [Helicocarpus griseus UAMH5409]
MPRRSRHRALEACSFCRRRKIKCNSERPLCVNCKTYGHDCVYEPISRVSKEAGRERYERTKRRKILQGSDAANPENRQRSLSSSHHAEDDVSGSSATVSNDRGCNMDSNQSWRSSTGPSSEASVARILVSANGVSSYHGRTSALFEDNNVHERPTGADHCPRMPDDWVERGLVAEAARQRQMEELNFRQGKLDFDGVDPDLGMHLLSLHWNRQHHSFLITYRPAFMRDMACNGPYFSKLLLNAIYFGAAKFSPRLEVRKDPRDVRTAGWQYRERVRELLGGALDRSDVTTIQALLVMTNSLFALGDERSAAWLYAGLAFRMLIDLGMHVDLTSTRRFSDEDLEIRRRIFWAAFAVVDKIQSLYQGRPVSLKEPDALVPIKFLDTFEELEHWQPFAYSTPASDYPGSPAYSISTFTFLCKLSITMSDILSCIYTERSFDQSPAELASMLEKLQLKLDNWLDSLPSHLQFDSAESQSVSFPPPHVFSLHAMYNVLVILLHRPFVADGHLYSTSRSISVDSFMKCASAASSICNLLRAYHRTFSTRRAPYLISYATYVAATIVSRIAARRGNDSTAHSNLATCLAVFKENQETNTAVQKAAMIVQNLMKKLGIAIDNLTSEALEVEPMRRSRDRELQPNRQIGGEARRLQPGDHDEVPNRTNANITSPHSAVRTPALAGTGYSPNPDWVDIDGIIQSFLHYNEGSGARPPDYYNTEEPSTQLPRSPWMPQQQQINASSAVMGNSFSMGQDMSAHGVPPPDSAENSGYQWQPQQGLRSTSSESASLEDPLFGFNGTFMDSFTFMGW